MMTQSSVARAARQAHAYRHLLLDPPSENTLLDLHETLGIEVTIPALAGRCSLGNLDPQHTGGDHTTAAIDLAWDASLPPRGATLATIRPDLDAIGSMAVFELRAAGYRGQAARRRSALIAGADTGQRDRWPGPRIRRSTYCVSPLAGIARIATDHELPLDERVGLLRDWLARGRCRGLAAATTAAAAELERREESARVRLGPSGYVAVVQSTELGATEIGYRCAPVVIAENPEFRFAGGQPHRKITIAQWEPGWVDLDSVSAELSRDEPGWGGSATIVGSPHGAASYVSTACILGVVERALVIRRSQ
jgi:hypothetical protein